MPAGSRRGTAEHGGSPAGGRRHLILLVAVVAMLFVRPLLAHEGPWAAAFSDLGFGLVYGSVIVVVFEAGVKRRTAFALFVPVLGSGFAAYALPVAMREPAEALFNCAIIVFLGYSVAIVLRDVSRRRVVRGDDVVGVVVAQLVGLTLAHAIRADEPPLR